jgi:hypothetical protein
MIHRETAAEYHARQAVSASFCWDIVKPEGCPAQAWHDSCFNPNRPPEEPNGDLEFGRIVHFAALEEKILGEQITIIDADNFRTKAAQELRDQARAEGKIPLLYEREKGYSFKTIQQIRRTLEESVAAELLFGLGESEVSFTWEFMLERGPYQAARDTGTPFDEMTLRHQHVIPCKARADRIIPGKLVDLKTAASASPAAFSRAMDRDGHHLRAAWYLDGWNEAFLEAMIGPARPVEEYLFVVVGKTEPHLVSIFTTKEPDEGSDWFWIDPHAVEQGRRLYQKALSDIRRARELGRWAGYSGRGSTSRKIVSLPAHAEYRIADMEAEGEL